MGLSATRTGYLNSSERSGRPLALAVTTYCLRSSSKSDPRKTRRIEAVPAVASTSTGAGRCFSMSMTLAKLHGASLKRVEKSPLMFHPR